MGSLDVRRVLNRAPWQLRESLAEVEGSLILHLEATLLRHRRVKAEKGRGGGKESG